MNLHLYQNISLADFEKVLNALPDKTSGVILWKVQSVSQNEQDIILKVKELLGLKVKTLLPSYVSSKLIEKVLNSFLKSNDVEECALRDVSTVKRLFVMLPKVVLGGGKILVPQEKYRGDNKIQKASCDLLEFFFQLKPILDEESHDIIVSGFFKEKNPELLLSLIEELQRFFICAFQAAGNLDSKEIPVFEALIGWTLSLIPFLEPLDGTLFSIPQKKHNVFELVDYKSEEVILTPNTLSSPMKAYGLVPKDGSPLLLFMGTPQRTASGMLLSVWSDFVPGFSVGELPFNLFHKRVVEKWLKKRTLDATIPAKIYGKSLGGALSLLTASEFPKHIDSVYAYNPPALYGRTYKKYNKALNPPKIRIYWQERDPVGYTGSSFPHSWEVFGVYLERKQNFFFAHLRALPALTPLILLREVKESERTRVGRVIFTFAHNLISIPIFFVLTTYLLMRSIVYKIRKYYDLI